MVFTSEEFMHTYPSLFLPSHWLSDLRLRRVVAPGFLSASTKWFRPWSHHAAYRSTRSRLQRNRASQVAKASGWHSDRWNLLGDAGSLRFGREIYDWSYPFPYHQCLSRQPASTWIILVRFWGPRVLGNGIFELVSDKPSVGVVRRGVFLWSHSLSDARSLL